MIVNGHIFRVKKSFLYFIDHILGHPVYQFLQKPDFSDFTVSGSGLPMGHRFRKYISLCWSNSYFMANAQGSRVDTKIPIIAQLGKDCNASLLPPCS